MLLFGCTESKTQTLNIKGDNTLNKIGLVDIEFTNWDRSEHLLIGSDSNWVNENIPEKNVELVFSDRFYLSDDEFKAIAEYLINNSSEQFTKTDVDANAKAIIVRLYKVDGTSLSFILQKDDSSNYLKKFIQHLRNLEYNQVYDEIIKKITIYDNLLDNISSSSFR